MKTQLVIDKLIDEYEWLYRKYAEEARAATQPFILEQVSRSYPGYRYSPEDKLVRERLLEHIGALPMITTTMYPYISDSEVDLGSALTMLAIHDIGELITGDEVTFTKKDSAEIQEQKAARKLLDKSYHDLYMDIEMQTSQTAKFAKAIDKLAGDLMDYITPADITIKRFKYFVGAEADEIIPLLVKHKRPYMEWNPFMKAFHIRLIERLEERLERVNL